ncbi:MAG: hypothetical protein K2X47_14175, partial [Bdellovibrionales bacterium]|nr:hypothetical protein [Bdellovibrionales bacterium]
MKTKINLFASCILVLGALLLGQQTLVAQEDVDLEAALLKLQESMGSGSETVPESDSQVDQALEALDEVVIPLPEAVVNSSIPLVTVTPAKAQEAAKIISATSMAGDLEADYRQSGTMMSLMLWNGAQTELQGLLNRILQQLYSSDTKMDPSLIRILVNSNPIPMINAPSPIDFNEEINQQKASQIRKTLKADTLEEAQERRSHALHMEELEEKKKPVWSYRPSRRFLTKAEAEKQIAALPERMGIQIELSAGLLASAKNVDEVAGQLALALAAHDPKIYGLEEDERFTKHRDNYDLIETIVQQSSLASKADITETRNRLKAGLSAVERLVRGGFNPWAIADYEERVYGWMADVYLTEKKHSLGRALLNAKKYNLLDASRPFRINLYTAYVQYLQK